MRFIPMSLFDVWASENNSIVIMVKRGHTMLPMHLLNECLGEDRRLSAQWETL